MRDITAIQLVRIGDHAIVKIEVGSRWVTVIKERYDGSFSHIVEEGGMVKCIEAVEEIEQMMAGKHWAMS